MAASRASQQSGPANGVLSQGQHASGGLGYGVTPSSHASDAALMPAVSSRGVLGSRVLSHTSAPLDAATVGSGLLGSSRFVGTGGTTDASGGGGNTSAGTSGLPRVPSFASSVVRSVRTLGSDGVVVVERPGPIDNTELQVCAGVGSFWFCSVGGVVDVPCLVAGSGRGSS